MTSRKTRKALPPPVGRFWGNAGGPCLWEDPIHPATSMAVKSRKQPASNRMPQANKRLMMKGNMAEEDSGDSRRIRGRRSQHALLFGSAFDPPGALDGKTERPGHERFFDPLPVALGTQDPE